MACAQAIGKLIWKNRTSATAGKDGSAWLCARRIASNQGLRVLLGQAVKINAPRVAETRSACDHPFF